MAGGMRGLVMAALPPSTGRAGTVRLHEKAPGLQGRGRIFEHRFRPSVYLMFPKSSSS